MYAAFHPVRPTFTTSTNVRIHRRNIHLLVPLLYAYLTPLRASLTRYCRLSILISRPRLSADRVVVALRLSARYLSAAWNHTRRLDDVLVVSSATSCVACCQLTMYCESV